MKYHIYIFSHNILIRLGHLEEYIHLMCNGFHKRPRPATYLNIQVEHLERVTEEGMKTHSMELSINITTLGHTRLERVPLLAKTYNIYSPGTPVKSSLAGSLVHGSGKERNTKLKLTRRNYTIYLKPQVI